MKNHKLIFLYLIFSASIFHTLNGQSAISIDPDSLSSSLITGETETHTLTISNSGTSILHWEMEIDWTTIDSVTFTKNNYGDWELPQNQDRVTDDLWITRGDFNALFNAFNEMCCWHPHGPDGTEWSVGSLDNIGSLTFESFVMALGHDVGTELNGDLIPNNQPMVMHIIEDDIYYEMQFHSWTEGGNGGGFSYTRTRGFDAISLSQESGSVSADTTTELTISLDASGLPSGDYYADIVITSNDPNNAEILVPIHLSITGAADIWVDPDTADFGEIYVNYAGAGNYGGTMEIRLGNDGSDDLNVSNISVDNTAFSVSPAWTSIDHGEWTILDVTYVTTDVGTDSGTITITSDDPDESTITIPIYANAVEPPEIDVSGEQTVDLDVGDTLDHVLTVSNNGSSDLIYEIDLYVQNDQQLRRPATVQDNSLKNPIPFEGNYDILEPETRERLHRSLQKLNSPENKVESEVSNEEDRQTRNSSRSWQLVYTDEDETDLTIDVGNVYADMTNEELLIKWESYVGWENTSGIATMFIYIDADQDPNTGRPMSEMIPWWNIGAEGMIVRYHDNWAKLVHFEYDPSYGDWVSYDVDTLTINSVEPYGNEVILGAASIYFDGTYTTYNVDGINFGMIVDNLSETSVDIVPDWPTSLINFDFSPGWLSVDTLSGVVPAGGSQNVTTTYNATGLIGGDYYADIIFYNNDPLTPEYISEAHMDVTGIPDIHMQDSEIDFGVSYVGFSHDLYLMIENTGTDVLEVQNITTDSENLSVTVTSFEIDALQSDSVQLVLNVDEVGDFSANVTIESNDPDEPSITLQVTSTLLVAPDINTEQESFIIALAPGESVLDTLTIDNDGGSDLDFVGEILFTTIREDVTDVQFEINILTDEYPGETSWSLRTSSGQTIASIAAGSLTNQETLYTWEYELGPGDYVWTIYDQWSDGICCGYGEGEYNLYLDGDLIATGGQFGQNESVDFSISSTWLTMDPESGTIPSDGSTDLTLVLDASSLEEGDYSADIYLTSNDPDESTVIIPVSLTVASVNIHDESLFPKEFALHQNFPNPFNPVTSIRYDLPQNEKVNVTIYDMLGRQVRLLVDSYQEAGFRSIIWDATTDHGNQAAAGVYLYKIQAGDFIQTRKMVLLK